MVTTITRGPAAVTPQTADVDENPLDGFTHAVIDSVVNRRGESLSLALPSEDAAIAVSSRLELVLLTVGMGRGPVSARVAPEFLRDTFPAMRSLTQALDAAGMSGLWSARDGRNVRLGDAWQTFISIDTPVVAHSDAPGRPDTLLELVSAHRIPSAWYRTRVLPRATARGLTTVFYGTANGAGGRDTGGDETLFGRVRRMNLTKEWRDGTRRHFDALGLTEAAAAD